jgi:hypothetical protein
MLLGFFIYGVGIIFEIFPKNPLYWITLIVLFIFAEQANEMFVSLLEDYQLDLLSFQKLPTLSIYQRSLTFTLAFSKFKTRQSLYYKQLVTLIEQPEQEKWAFSLASSLVNYHHGNVYEKQLSLLSIPLHLQNPNISSFIRQAAINYVNKLGIDLSSQHPTIIPRTPQEWICPLYCDLMTGYHQTQCPNRQICKVNFNQLH